LVKKGDNKCKQIDILEVYAYPNSQLTEVANASGLRAKRFTLEDGTFQPKKVKPICCPGFCCIDENTCGCRLSVDPGALGIASTLTVAYRALPRFKMNRRKPVST
jgi:hypothetical protein